MTRAQEEEDIDGISCGCTRICVQPRNLARGTWWLTQKIYIIYNFLLISKFYLQTKNSSLIHERRQLYLTATLNLER